jgi:putative Holliday junction resolvase
VSAASPARIVLGLDFGLRRIGVALTDTLSRAPRPLSIVANGGRGPDWPALDRLMSLHGPHVLVLGSPYNEDGTAGRMLPACDRFAAQLRERYRLPVERVDEYHSSREAGERLVEQRREGTRRRRIRRADIDNEAAAIILQRWLAGEGDGPGEGRAG